MALIQTIDPKLKKKADDGTTPTTGIPPVVAPNQAAQLSPMTARPYDDGYNDLRAVPGQLKAIGSSIASGSRAFDASMNKQLAPGAPSVVWNAYPTRGPMGQAAIGASDTAYGHPILRLAPPNFLRPPVGPGSEAAIAARSLRAKAPALTTAPPTIANSPRNFSPAADNISQSNLAAANRLTVPNNGTPGPLFAGVTGSATPATQLKPPGVDVNGHHLDYGAMVNGVPTFSDGSSDVPGVAGSIPRTMDDKTIAGLASRLQIQPPQVSALASDSMGGATPTQGQMVAQRMAQITQPITGSRPSAQMFADADRNAIASGDWRSAAGTVAHNLQVDAASASTPRLRRIAENSLAALQAGTQQGALATQQAEAQAANTAAVGENGLQEQQMRGQNALQAIQLHGQNALENTKLETSAKLRQPEKGTQVELADGTIGLLNPITGAVVPGKLPDGTTAKGQPKNPPAPIYTTAGGSASLESLTNNILKVNPLSGMLEDKNVEGGWRLPNNEERFAAMQKAQWQLQQLGGTQGASSTAPEAPITATGPNGQRLQKVNGQWVPLNG